MNRDEILKNALQDLDNCDRHTPDYYISQLNEIIFLCKTNQEFYYITQNGLEIIRKESFTLDNI